MELLLLDQRDPRLKVEGERESRDQHDEPPESEETVGPQVVTELVVRQDHELPKI